MGLQAEDDNCWEEGTTTRRWYVIRTEPRAEYLAASELVRDGFEIFLPRVNTPHPRMGHSDEPFFPSYLFIRCDPESDGWPSFRKAHRVSGWVIFDGVIPSVPDETVADLIQHLEMINREGGSWRRFHPGEKVRVVSAGMQSLAEVLEEPKSPQARVKVLLQFMGRRVSAHVPWESLLPADNEPGEKPRLPRRTRGKGRWVQGFGPRAAASARD